MHSSFTVGLLLAATFVGAGNLDPIEVADQSCARAVAGAPEVCFWTRFHGADGDNRSQETGLLKQWPTAARA